MFNRERTKEVFGYDIDPQSNRKSKEEQLKQPGLKRSDMRVIDNCPECNLEREISYKQSQMNKSCSRCFHNSPDMINAKQNQTKIKSEEHKQKMKDNHWSKKGMSSPFKGQNQTKEAKELIRIAKEEQFSRYSEEELRQMKIKESCTKRGISIEEFDGFSAPEGTRIRQSAEGKAWTYDVLAKSNFTCEVCSQKGGSLQAHHLNGFNSFPEQRFDVDNGVCLCENCHDEFHQKYGKGDNTIEQYLDFLKSKPQLDIGLYPNKI